MHTWKIWFSKTSSSCVHYPQQMIVFLVQLIEHTHYIILIPTGLRGLHSLMSDIPQLPCMHKEVNQVRRLPKTKAHSRCTNASTSASCWSFAYERMTHSVKLKLDGFLITTSSTRWTEVEVVMGLAVVATTVTGMEVVLPSFDRDHWKGVVQMSVATRFSAIIFRIFSRARSESMGFWLLPATR